MLCPFRVNDSSDCICECCPNRVKTEGIYVSIMLDCGRYRSDTKTEMIANRYRGRRPCC